MTLFSTAHGYSDLAGGGEPLSPLDGRYRAVAAPLVNHLSEAALNRARLQVEVEWLIHLTDGGVLPGAPRLSETENELPARRRRGLRGRGDRRARRHRGRDPPRRQGRRVPPQAAPGRGRPGPRRRRRRRRPHRAAHGRRDRPHLLHQRGHQQPLLRPDDPGAVEQVWLPAARGLVEGLAAMAHEHADAAMLARTHGQPATPTTLGKEMAVLAHRLRRQIAPRRGHRVPGQDQRRHRHVRPRTSSRCPAPTGRPWRAASSSTWA